MTLVNHLAMRAAETMAWWEMERPLVLQPDGSIRRHSRLTAEEAYAADNPGHAVRDLVEARSDLLRRSGWRGASRPALPPGRFLLLLTSQNLADGAAHLSSSGFFGELNFPPCDLWVDFLQHIQIIRGKYEPALLSWVPAEFVSLAQQGINVNPEECLGWIEDLAPQLQRPLASLLEGHERER